MVKNPLSPTDGSKSNGDVSPWAVASLGAQFFAGILIFLYFGNWLDEKWSTSPLFLLSGVLLGGGGVFYSGYRRLTALERNAHASRASHHSASPIQAEKTQHEHDGDRQHGEHDGNGFGFRE